MFYNTLITFNYVLSQLIYSIFLTGAINEWDFGQEAYKLLI